MKLLPPLSRIWKQVLEFMGPHTKNEELCPRGFSKSPTNNVFTWYATLKPDSITTWDNTIESFCSNFFFFYEWETSTLSLFTTPSKILLKDFLITSIDLKILLLVFMSSMKGTNLHQQYVTWLSRIPGKSWYPFDFLHNSKMPTR